MPSGQTHDRITLWSLPLVAGLTFGQTQSSNLTLLVSGGFLFGGLMFGPDLDIYSRQYKRWGYFRWIWLPYQKLLRHRSFWSHGPLIGTTLRIIYLGSWLSLVALICVAIAHQFWQIKLDWPSSYQMVQRSLQQHTVELFACYVGLELGAMSHSLSDWSGSAYKRFKTHGLRGLLPSRYRTKKRKRQTMSRVKPLS